MVTNKRTLICLLMVLAAGFFLFKTLNARSEMYKWQRLTDLPYKVKTMDFASATVGWRVDELPRDFVGDHKYRLLTTSDGGRTWNILYRTNERIYKIRYMHEMKSLFALVLEESPELKRKLSRSDDGGRTWKEVCQLSFSAQGVYFFDDYNGYAWSRNKIKATYNAGKTWHLIAKKKIDGLVRYGQMQITGNNRYIYFVEDQKVFGFNFWQGKKIALPLPLGFDPEAVIAKWSEEIVYVLGKLADKWTFLAFEDGRLMLNESVPVEEKEFLLSSFTYGDNVINLVGSTRGDFFVTSYFYRRDVDGWHKESISGSDNYHLFAYWSDKMWTQRVSLRRGTRELLIREVVE
jgi:hypothetical protein